MLRHLRKISGSRYLWIDAICLNQADDAEKATQIPLMGEIYGQARKVRIWLGAEIEDPLQVFAFLRAIVGLNTTGEELVQRVQEIADRVFTDSSLKLLRRFLCLPWFSRRWVLQEAALARDARVHLGNYTIPWGWLASAADILETATWQEFGLSGEALNSLSLISTLWSLKSPGNHLLELLWKFHSAHCTDPRDRLFAVIGLAHSDERSNMHLIQYSQHWTKIFHQYAITTLGKFRYSDENLVHRQLLTHVLAFGSLCDLDESMPSWLPDWSKQRRYMNFLLYPALADMRLWSVGLPTSPLYLSIGVLGKITHKTTFSDASCTWKEVDAYLNAFLNVENLEDRQAWKPQRRQDYLRTILHIIISMLAKEHTSSLRRIFSDESLSTEFHRLEEFIFQHVAAHSRPFDPHTRAHSQLSSSEGRVQDDGFLSIMTSGSSHALADTASDPANKNASLSSLENHLLDAVVSFLRQYWFLRWAREESDVSFGFSPRAPEVGDFIAGNATLASGADHFVRTAMILSIDGQKDFMEKLHPDESRNTVQVRILGPCFHFWRSNKWTETRRTFYLV
jgi:hypothetical protein